MTSLHTRSKSLLTLLCVLPLSACSLTDILTGVKTDYSLTRKEDDKASSDYLEKVLDERLKEKVKTLSKEELCHFDKAGNFVLKGNNKLNKQYNSKKAVPIEIGSFRETKLFSFRVRIKKMEQQQKKRIDRRSEQGKIIGKMEKGYNLSKSQFNFRKAWNDKDLEYSQNSESFNANTVLSNEGFSKLKFGELKSKSSGNYWKKKLVEAGVIKTKRQFEFLKRCSQKEYLSLRYSGFRNLVFKNGKLYKETVSKFTTTEFYKPKEEIKELKHLSFDFCFFLAQQ